MLTNNVPTASVAMDSRKFLSIINESAQAKIAFFESKVAELGKAGNRNWRLASLDSKKLVIEDVDTHTYLMADHAKDNGRITISNIQPITIVESEKKDLFIESCEKLIEAISTNDMKGMGAAYSRMKAQRFSSRAVPYSGVVKCRDGVQRMVTVATESSLDFRARNQIVEAAVSGLRNKVIVENGNVVSAQFQDRSQFKLPITKWGVQKQIARRMRDVAQNAYMSEGFQNRILDLSNLISEGKIEEAVKMVTPFLQEMEEFTLLSRGKTLRLIENALATKGVFNQELCEDTANLFYRTNLQQNRSKIIKEWKGLARKVGSMPLSENVARLQESSNFEDSMDKFLTLVFETISNREIAAEALATSLQSLRDKTPKIKESHDLSSKLNGLINRLKQPNFDDAAIYEAEDLIATIQEELTGQDSLQNFDQLPGGDAGLGDGVKADPLAAGAGGTPPIVINSPLIQIGGTSGSAEEAAGGLDDTADLDLSDDAEEPADLLGNLGDAAAQAPPGGAAPAPGAPQAPPAGQPLMQSRERKGRAVSESADPYAYTSKPQGVSRMVSGYGTPAIANKADMEKIVKTMHRLAVEHKLTGADLRNNLASMAKVSIQALGFRIPEGHLIRAINEATTSYMATVSEGKPFPGAAPPFGKKGKAAEDCDDCDDGDDAPSKSKKPWEDGDDDEGVAEDQFKGPWRKTRGLKRSGFKKTMPMGSVTESITWGESQPDAIMGTFNRVNFIFDHGGSQGLEPVILSESGDIEIPIPTDVQSSAFAAAKLGKGDPSIFVEWLGESIEQLRPIDDTQENRDIAEAVARITSSPDGTLSVEVTPDTAVSDLEEGGEAGLDDEMGGMDDADNPGPEGDLGPDGAAMDDGMGMADGMGETGDDMMPVDSIEGDEAGMEETDTELGENDMPDFEGGGDIGSPDATGGPAAAPPASGVGGSTPPTPPKKPGEMLEDKDITNPKSSKYSKHVNEDPRTEAKPETMSDSGDDLDGIGPDLEDDDGTGSEDHAVGHQS